MPRRETYKWWRAVHEWRHSWFRWMRRKPCKPLIKRH